MASTLTLSILEIILLFFGAIILGITIHFTIASRRSLKGSMGEKDEISKSIDEWKSRYFNDVELRDKELFLLKEQLAKLNRELSEAEENVNIYTIEAEEMRRENVILQTEIRNMPKITPQTSEKPDYLEQLKFAQTSLLEHNEKINQLIGNIDAVKEIEEKQREILKENEELSLQIDQLRMKLIDKEKEISNNRQKEQLTNEMTSMLDNAYNDFNALQTKMQKLELQVTSSKMINMEYEDLREGYHKMTRDFEEQRLKLNNYISENQQLQKQLMETEDRFREANFQRQQLQKRVVYLEELNNDLHVVADANKKLEGQLKRIGELESMLNVVAEERDQLMRRSET